MAIELIDDSLKVPNTALTKSDMFPIPRNNNVMLDTNLQAYLLTLPKPIQDLLGEEIARVIEVERGICFTEIERLQEEYDNMYRKYHKWKSKALERSYFLPQG